MFDAITFDVGMTTDEGFERVGGALRYVYSYVYEKQPEDKFEEKKLSDNFLKSLITQTAAADKETEIKDFVPAYANNAINFATDDMGSDKSMGGVLLYILVAVLAFICAVTINTSLEKESSVIGTLRASGFTKGELVRYYMSAPVLVIAGAAIVGNILGYTCMKNVIVAMYYNSYSLPTYETVWTPDAFVKTTVVPVIIMIVINLFVITRKLKLSPLRFLRHDLKKTRRKKAIRLPKWKFFARFRMRVFLQNIPNYIMAMSLDRPLFNVATSRAKQLTIIVCDPSLKNENCDKDVRRYLDAVSSNTSPAHSEGTEANVKKVHGEKEKPGLKVLGKIDLSKFETPKQKAVISQVKNNIYIIDTNVFVKYPNIIYKIGASSQIVLSAKVIDELDKLKIKLDAEGKHNVEKALRNINHAMDNPNVSMELSDPNLLPEDFDKRSSDNNILTIALKFKADNPILLTSDNGLQIKAKGLKVATISLKEFLKR